MSITGDLGAQLGASLGDHASVWRFVRSFADGWLSPLVDGDGYGAEELAAAEAELDVRLPDAVREAYGLFGRRTDLTSNQDRLLSPPELHVDAAGQALVFRVENQHVCSWGIPLSDLGAPDPPVVIGEIGQIGPWQPWLDHFSTACVEMVLSESLYSSFELGDNRDLEPDEVVRLDRLYTRLPLPDYPTSGTAAPGAPHRWYAGADVILREDEGEWVWVRARTPAALDQVRAALPGEWLMSPSNGRFCV